MGKPGEGTSWIKGMETGQPVRVFGRDVTTAEWMGMWWEQMVPLYLISSREPSEVFEQRSTIMGWNNERLKIRRQVQRSGGFDKRTELEAGERLQDRQSKENSRGRRGSRMDWTQER